MNQLENITGLFTKELYRSCETFSVLIYNKELLETRVNNPIVKEILKRHDYPTDDLKNMLEHLSMRFTSCRFPHEIGVFLGTEGAGASVTVKNVSEASIDDINCDIICLGCSSMGDEVLEEVEFEPYVVSIEGSVSGKKLALFGSYGWGDGQWMRDWDERMKNAGAELVCERLIVNEMPSGDECKTFGAQLVK